MKMMVLVILNYLTKCKDRSEDEEEREGLQELLELILQTETNLVKQQKEQEMAQKAKKAAEAAAAANRNSADDDEDQQTITSNADVLKQANAIDQAVMTAAQSDDEKSSDFISDCREVVNLSGGFNNQGRMRVGG